MEEERRGEEEEVKSSIFVAAMVVWASLFMLLVLPIFLWRLSVGIGVGAALMQAILAGGVASVLLCAVSCLSIWADRRRRKSRGKSRKEVREGKWKKREEKKKKEAQVHVE